MLEFKLRFPVKEDAEKLNEIICGWFQGSPMFVNNDIVVTSVRTSWVNNKLNWIFSVCIDDESEKVNRIDLEVGSLGIQVSEDLVWAVVKDKTNE